MDLQCCRGISSLPDDHRFSLQGSCLFHDREREVAQHIFKAFLDQHGIKHIVARIKHPQTNGKIERFET